VNGTGGHTGSGPGRDGRAGRVEVRHVALVVNPASGRGRAGQVARRARTHWERAGITTRELLGESPAHARRLVAEAAAEDRVDAVVVCGGDGMISLVVDELAGGTTPVGVVPAGSGNDFARDLGIPRGDPEAAAEIVAAGRVRAADLGCFTEPGGRTHHYATVLCAGFDSSVSGRVNEMRRFSGSLRYLAATAETFPHYEARPFRFTFDDGEVVEERVLLSAYGITRYYGGGMKICPDADREDGLLDVTWIPDMSKPKAAWRFASVFRGAHVRLPEVRTRRCRWVRVEATGVEAFADGDRVADLPGTVGVAPAALTYLVP